MSIRKVTVDSLMGPITLGAEGERIVSLEFRAGGSHFTEDPTLKEAAKQLRQYLSGQRTHFDLKLGLDGTDFQKRVWDSLRKIPYGQTVSYGDLARSIGTAGASRAVGSAVGKNPIPIIIPCHRVIREDGSLGGFSSGTDKKLWLLDLESDLPVDSARRGRFEASPLSAYI